MSCCIVGIVCLSPIAFWAKALLLGKSPWR
jgi:hypothetical protein